MEKINPGLADNVAETLLIPLWMRAKESLRPDAIINDPVSCHLAGQIDYDFTRFDADTKSLCGVAVRTRYLDRVAEHFIATHERPVLVCIGCGLDPRFHRLPNRERAVCYELDLPEVIALRRRLLPPEPGEHYLAASVFSTDWMESLRDAHPGASFLFISEGVFMYFDEAQVRQVVIDLAIRFPGSELYFERMSRFMCRQTDRHKSVSHTRARFRWGIDDPHDLEAWASGIRLIDTFYYADDAKERWGFAGRIMRLIPFLHRSFGVWGYSF